MATARNFSMSGINLGHHNLPTYQMSLKSDNVEFVRYIGGRGQVHGVRKERRRIRIINNKKRSKNNKSPNIVWET